MIFKRLLYKFTNTKKYIEYKKDLWIQEKRKVLKSGFEDELIKIQEKISNRKELSFLHSGHLGDIINSLPVVKELSKTHKCNFYIRSNKPLPNKVKGYKHPKDLVYLNDKLVAMIMPLLRYQEYINNINEHYDEEIDIDLDLFQKIPMNFNLDEVRWYFQLTGVQTDLSIPYLKVKPHEKIKDKVVIMRSLRRKNIFINYKFLKKYEDLLFLGVKDEYDDLKKEVPHLEFYDCKDFLEAAEIIKSSKFFLGNSSFGFTIAEGLKVPRLMESFPDFPMIYPIGNHGYDFYFQNHFEKWFDFLYKLKN